MYALIDTQTGKKIKEAKTPGSAGENKAWLPVVYYDRPTGILPTQTADRVEAVEGLSWGKPWVVRDRTDAELDKSEAARLESIIGELESPAALARVLAGIIDGLDAPPASLATFAARIKKGNAERAKVARGERPNPDAIGETP